MYCRFTRRAVRPFAPASRRQPPFWSLVFRRSICRLAFILLFAIFRARASRLDVAPVCSQLNFQSHFSPRPRGGGATRENCPRAAGRIQNPSAFVGAGQSSIHGLRANNFQSAPTYSHAFKRLRNTQNNPHTVTLLNGQLA
eukprot:GHVT01071797.1.p1 GENE.GHVT01071797.1~~GHVT01071797.1.p1  ORF type:complete len:141 (+),score=7.07 GHVT01071797.1:841-1263(+)